MNGIKKRREEGQMGDRKRIARISGGKVKDKVEER
jgi:hypothetical protein